MGIRGRRIKSSDQLTAANIINGYCSTVIRTQRQNKVYPNTYIGSWECDILEVTKAGYTHEYEVKISRADFKADSLKQKDDDNKYDVLQAGQRVNYFSYVCPPGLLAIEDVPEWAGLIYVDSYNTQILSPLEHDVVECKKVVFHTVKAPTKLSRNKIEPKLQAQINECIYYRFHALREKLNKTVK